MSSFAKGKRAVAMCDRCGHKVRYMVLRTEWNGLRVCPTCYEAKHPALTPRTHTEKTALEKPRPDADNVSTTVTQLSTVIPMTFGG